jgi:hypothetical protein
VLALFIERFPILTDMYCVSLVGRLIGRIWENVRQLQI